MVAGFGGLLFLMALSAVGSLFLLRGLRSGDAGLQAHFLSRSQTLEQIRSAIYLSGTFARDYLLAPAPDGSIAQRSALTALRKESESSLQTYARSLGPEEVKPFHALEKQIEDYWQVLDRTFRWGPAERAKFEYAFFYDELVPRRTSMLQIADRIAELNELSLKRGNEQLGQRFGRLQSILGLVDGLTFLSGALLAAFTIHYLLRLEAEASRRLSESVAAKASLRELSAKLLRAQEDERRSLSRELHDEAAQKFSAILMEAENLLDLGPGEPVRARLECVRAQARIGLDEIRNMALLLRPSMLDDFGLVPALNWQGREIARRTGLRVQVAAGELADELPEEHRTCIYRVVQEALNNCSRHARASTVQVAIRAESNQIHLSIQDDGSGFDPQRVRGLGLLGMEERVRHLGGSFDVDSHPGLGTTLKVKLPLATLTEIAVHA